MVGKAHTRKRYVNDEPLRRCSIKGCGELKPGRAMHQHVKWTKDVHHGDRGEVPLGWSVEDCPVVGTIKVDIYRRNDYQDDHDRWMCDHCGGIFKGKSGLGVHLKRTDDFLHRNTPEEPDYSNHNHFPVEEDGTIYVPGKAWVGIIYNTLSNEELAKGIDVKVDKDRSKPDRILTIVDDSTGQTGPEPTGVKS